MGKGGAQYNINRATNDTFYRYKMPAIQTKIEGRGNGIKTVIDNCTDVGIALNRPPEYVCKFFGFELGAQTQIEKRHEAQPKYIVNGSHTNEFLQDKLDIFIRNWVLCEKCENPETTLRIGKEKKNQSITATCKACGTSYLVTKDQGGRMRKYIQMYSPEKLGFVSGKGTAGDGDANKQDSDDEEIVPVEGREWGAETSAATDLDARVDRYLMDGLTGKMADMQVDNSVIEELETDKKVECFVRHFKKTKKQLSKNDQPGKTWEDDGPAEIKKLSEALQLGAYTIFALNEIAEFTSKSSWEKLEKAFVKFEEILVAICENNDKNQNSMCGLVEMCIEANKKKMMPYAANIFKKLYDDDIVSDKVILAWSEKPTKKYTSKKFVQKIVDNENMKKLLEWMKDDDDSSSESESESESEDENNEEENKNEPEKKVEPSVDAEKTSAPPAAAAAAAWSEDDEDIDIDNI